MHIYAFGSLCRGDVDLASDVDLLALVSRYEERFDANIFSVYGYERISALWSDGNPFAWHLAKEARLIHASDGVDFLKALGDPAAYRRQREDCEKFRALFREARADLQPTSPTLVFDLSTIFLAVRNFASCYLLGEGAPDFSRRAALYMGPESIRLPKEVFSVFERARLLCTRGVGIPPSEPDSDAAVRATVSIETWMTDMLEKVPS